MIDDDRWLLSYEHQVGDKYAGDQVQQIYDVFQVNHKQIYPSESTHEDTQLIISHLSIGSFLSETLL